MSLVLLFQLIFRLLARCCIDYHIVVCYVYDNKCTGKKEGGCVVAQTSKEIIREIREQINKSWESPRRWYVGISADARKALFSDHHVRERGDGYKDRWIYCRADSVQDAKNAAAFFSRSFFWHADCRSDFQDTGLEVYAYLKGSHTVP